MTNNVQANQGGESQTRTYVMFLLGILALAFSAPWVKLSNFEPATSVLLRCSIGLLVLIPFAIVEMKKMGSLNKQGILLSLLAGLFLGIDFTAWNFSIYYAGSGIASVLLNLQVIILPALAFIFDRERVPRSFFIIAPVMIIGVVMTGGVLDGLFGIEAAAVQGPETVYGIGVALFGTLAGMLSGLCYGIYLYTSRKATMVNSGQFVQPMAWATLAQLVAPTIFGLVSARGLDITYGVMKDGVIPGAPDVVGDPITASNWFWVIILAVFGQAMAWTFVQYGSVRLESTAVAGLLLLSPIATVAVISPIMFAEIPSIVQIIGVVIVLGAVAVQNDLHTALKNKLSGGKS